MSGSRTHHGNTPAYNPLTDKDLKEMDDEGLRKILATHEPEPLPASAQDQFNVILEKCGTL